MRARFAIGLLALACGRSSLYPGSDELETSGGTNAQAGKSATGGRSGSAGSAGSATLPSGGASSGGMANAAGSGGAAGAPQSTPVKLLGFHQLHGDGGICRPRLFDIERAPNGDIALGGSFCDELRLDTRPPLPTTTNGVDGFVLVLDEQFEPRWAWSIDGNKDLGAQVSAVAFLPNGHLAAQGEMADFSTFVVELDASGHEVQSWQENDGSQYALNSLLYDSKLGLVQVGAARAPAAPPELGPWSLYWASLDPLSGDATYSYRRIDGWEQTFAVAGAWAAPGELVTCGWGSVGSDIVPGYVQRLSTTGSPLFTTLLETDDGVVPVGVAVDRDGNFVLGGAFHGSLRLGSDELRASAPGLPSEWLAKLDRDGKPLWLKSWHAGLTGISSVALDEQDDILVSGTNEQGLYIREVSREGASYWSLELEADKVGSVRLIADGPHQLLLAGDGSNAHFFVELTTDEESIFLLQLGY